MTVSLTREQIVMLLQVLNTASIPVVGIRGYEMIIQTFKVLEAAIHDEGGSSSHNVVSLGVCEANDKKE